MTIPYRPTPPYLQHLAQVIKAVDRCQNAVDEGAERGSSGSMIEVSWDDLNVVCGWFADLHMTMKRAKDFS